MIKWVKIQYWNFRLSLVEDDLKYAIHRLNFKEFEPHYTRDRYTKKWTNKKYQFTKQVDLFLKKLKELGEEFS